MQNGRIRCKIALRLKNVCYKVSLCENCQRQRRNSPYFASLTELYSFSGRLYHSGEDRPMMSVNIVSRSSLLLLAKTNPPCGAAIAELLVFIFERCPRTQPNFAACSKIGQI